jgi:hypothetical protein
MYFLESAPSSLERGSFSSAARSSPLASGPATPNYRRVGVGDVDGLVKILTT